MPLFRRTAEKPSRQPVPADAEYQKASAEIREVFKSDFEAAKNPAEKLALAKKLRQTGSETPDNPVARFVLWKTASELAIQAANLETAFTIIDDLAGAYDLDGFSVKAKTYSILAERVATKDLRDMLAAGSTLLDQALAEDRLDLAAMLNDHLVKLGQRATDAAVVRAATARRPEIERLTREYAEVKKGLDALGTSPNDPGANLVVGKHYCFVKGDWERGLPLLRLSSDAALQDLAKKELSAPQKSAEQIELADGWWKLAESEKSALKERFQSRAAIWYRQGLSETIGLAKAKIEARLAEADKAAGASKSVATNTVANSIGMRLALVPAGIFTMGSEETPEELKKVFQIPKYLSLDDAPQHKIRISKPFYLGVHEVTVGQFKKFAQETSYQSTAETTGKGAYSVDTNGWVQKAEYNWRNPGFVQTDDHPVICVSWNDASAFCAWLSKKENKKYRLPTEAEWEYSCRAGTTTRFYCGNDPEGLAKFENVADRSLKTKVTWTPTIASDDGYVATSPVGKFKPNPFGLYDMHGNAYEWCADWYGKDFYATSPAVDPTGPTSGTDRVFRGGAWIGEPVTCRSGSRRHIEPGWSSAGIGFRVVCEK